MSADKSFLEHIFNNSSSSIFSASPVKIIVVSKAFILNNNELLFKSFSIWIFF